MRFARKHLNILPHPIASLKSASGRVFTLHSGQHFKRFERDTLDYTAMDVTCDGKPVAQIFDGSTYGWGNVHASLSRTRGLGYGLGMHDFDTHDTGPVDDIGKAMTLVAKRVEHMWTVRAAG